MLKDHDTSSNVFMPEVVHRPRQKVLACRNSSQCVVSERRASTGLLSKWCRRFPPIGTSGTHACRRTSRYARHHEVAGTLDSASRLHMPSTTFCMAFMMEAEKQFSLPQRFAVSLSLSGEILALLPPPICCCSAALVAPGACLRVSLLEQQAPYL